MAEPSEASGLSEEGKLRLKAFHDSLQEESRNFVGYPCNGRFDYSELFPFLAFPINNVGDPFVPSNFHLNTHEFECEVLETFRELTHGSGADVWGYVTNGGTEGNMYGIFLGRELYPDGLVYYSEDTHYSVNKILRCLHVRNIMIKSGPDGRIDLEDLRETIRIHRDVPPIVFANVGTTMKGAVDDIAGIREIFDDLAVQRHYIHADAALSGMILPFVDEPEPWDFAAGVDSISISGHKMIGSPIPCGVALARKANVDRIARRIEYVGTLDTTLSGSRNAITPLFMWYALQTKGVEGLRRMVADCFDVADGAVERLQQAGWNAWRHKNSITVVFDRPPMDIVSRWQLAVYGETAHLITMPHVTGEQIDRFVDDLVSRRSGEKTRS